MYDLSVLIPARNEMFLAKTVENLLENIRGNTEIIVFLDGAWADPGIKNDKRVTIIYSPVSVGQRAGTNQACRLSKAKWVMKLDAHSAVDEGFDVKLLAEAKENQTIIPALYNLHAFDWVCRKCGNRWYQSPTPEYCMRDYDGKLRNENCDGREFYRDIKWKPRLHKRSEFYRFDTTLHFQYHRARKKHPQAQEDIAETMSAQGSCFMLTREKYWELNICDEGHGSWGQQGTEVACKTWLSGGQLVTNKKTWYSHMFRTQGGDFGFPYPISGKSQEAAREYSRNMWFNNTWEKQIYPLSWLLEKFEYPEDWSDEKNKEVVDMVKKKGEEFKMKHNPMFYMDGTKVPTKGIIYYTDNQIPFKFAHNVRKHILKANLPIVSASLKPMNFGKNIHVKLQRGYEAYFTQILTALENSDSDIIFFTEHDVYYHRTHFDFIPPRRDTFYYNYNFWRVRSTDGHSVHYDTEQVNLIVAYRDLFLEYYRKQYDLAKKYNFDSKFVRTMSFEPGTRNRVRELSGYKCDKFYSRYPCLDIRHGTNLTASRWSKDQFRDQRNCQGWKECKAWEIDGWDFWVKDEKEKFNILNVAQIG